MSSGNVTARRAAVSPYGNGPFVYSNANAVAALFCIRTCERQSLSRGSMINLEENEFSAAETTGLIGLVADSSKTSQPETGT